MFYCFIAKSLLFGLLAKRNSKDISIQFTIPVGTIIFYTTITTVRLRVFKTQQSMLALYSGYLEGHNSNRLC